MEFGVSIDVQHCAIKSPTHEIARRTGLSRNAIEKYLRAGAVEPKVTTRRRPSKSDPMQSAGQLVLQVHRFRCSAKHCPVSIFFRRFAPAVTRPYSRRTGRVQGLVYYLPVVLGGTPRRRRSDIVCNCQSARTLFCEVSRRLWRMKARLAPPSACLG